MTLHELSNFATINKKRELEASANDVMLISEVAAEVGLEPKTIRFYERAKLINPKKHGRIRIFRSKDLARLLVIKKLRQYGLPLASIRSIIRTEGDLTLEIVNSPNVQELLGHHLVEMNRRQEFIQEQIVDLKTRLDCAKAENDRSKNITAPAA